VRKLLLTTLLLLLPVSVAAAAELQQGDQCLIGADKTIDGNLYSVCQSLVIDGTVHGDVVALAGSAAINGTVDGDLTAAAGQLTVNGTIGGDVRVLAARLLIASGARLTAQRGDVAGVGLSAELMAPVSGDFLFLGYQAIVGSTIGGNARFNGVSLAINGQIEGNADVHVESEASAFRPPDIPSLGLSFMRQGLSIAQDGGQHVKVDLRYESPYQIDIAPGTVGGEVHFVQGPTGGQIGIAPLSEVLGNYVGRILRDLLALMTIGLVLLLLAQNALQATGWRLRSRTRASFGYGLIAFLLFFPAALLLAVLNVAILGLVQLLTLGELTFTTALLLAIIDLVLVGGFWFVVAFVARIVICYVIGQQIGHRVLLTTDRATTLVISLLIGVVTYAAISNLPIGLLGVIVNAVMIFLGLGAIVLYMRDSLFRRVPVTVTGVVDDFAALPADVESRPGMDNLPEGFTWFDH
jgi:cytoskeletal protein CcmA (bactofilin family)